ncbi:exonuclease domain-containing protein [Tengunoibacter tsumagoiensis]|uniref:UvrABC system protein C n=1 Tax=Tengunoibacter tsumagoiensis TaxID=2014871 RepID=A0A401ZYW2_9CHLR|nr:exonuclease domain-containing protein [Tengunoibacter tsumagoiensis]GCE12027.1 hypothetical protein KTT_18860 [Tengunoibacter tsumagoiensis]
MAQEDGSPVPARGTLVRRAYELLESQGQPVPEEALIEYLFGANGNKQLWTTLLRKTLRGSSLFESVIEPEGEEQILWSLAAWRSLKLRLEDVEFIVVDTETTGLRPGPDRVIEIAAVRVQGGRIVDTFQTLVNPERRIPPFIAKFTGITQDMVDEAPTARQIFANFLEFLGDGTLVGHNLSFDLNFLSYEAKLLRKSLPLDGFDTIPLARRFLPGLKRFKLDMVATHLNIPVHDRHRALGDAEVTAAVFLRILEEAQKQGIYTHGHLRRRVQLPVAWSGEIEQVEPVGKGKLWDADGKLTNGASGMTRPTGTLLLNPAWKRDFPNRPGVYLMKDEFKQVIYVGKAKSLKDRLSSYYSQPLGYTKKMDGLLQSVREIETRVLGSELEALLVESRLIKELQPAYNVQLRNYELYPFIKIDVQHPFPRVYATREVTADGARYFGPFRSRRMVDVTIELVQKIFPIRTCTRSLPPQAKATDPCLRLHLGRCSAPCRGGADVEDYRKVIEQVCSFLGGESEDLLERLRRQMFDAAQNLNFERAAWLRDAIHSADEILIGQRLITGAVEANNLFIVYPSANEGHNELFLIRHGRLVQQASVLHERTVMEQAVKNFLDVAAQLGAPPTIVGKAEVDQINIISRWIHRHSDDRAFFPFQHVLGAESSIQQLSEQMWSAVEEARTLPLEALLEETDPIDM